MSELAPQSRSRLPSPAPDRCRQVWSRPPLPNESPEPTKRSVIGAMAAHLASPGAPCHPRRMPPTSIKIEHARYVITVDDQRRIIRDGSVLVERGRISRVGRADELAGARADRVIDARDFVVTPGFVNGHMHISYGHVVRGIFPDDVGSPLEHVFKLQMAMTEEEEHASSLLGLVELLKNGTVCLVDPGSTKFPDACLQAYEDAGIRVILGECVTDREAPFPLPRFAAAEAIQRTSTFLEKWHGRLDG